MSSVETSLRQLRDGDRVQYHGIQWQVKDYSTYTDHGYETEEWLLTAQTGKEYYLLREVDPAHQLTPIQWYIAEELQDPCLYDPHSARDVTLDLADAMRHYQSPYPELQLFNRVYQFESQTAGDYESDGSTLTRITWDYWDPSHLWNLALEAWSHGKLCVYSTRTVQPTDFTQIDYHFGNQSSGNFSASTHFGTSSVVGGQSFGSQISNLSARNKQFIAAWLITIVGFLFFIAGI
ncbi:MAG: DUF4178 domain-containing protein [Scytolyngbya sp. HA4215-MV1]|jgi:hypothetical protein|nr:DUF4178 domain-containing protein [Scytolyngbya sp. HA4215-MV1]